eukprot:jgi/Ulvmu1/5769/UM025_0023.1
MTAAIGSSPFMSTQEDAIAHHGLGELHYASPSQTNYSDMYNVIAGGSAEVGVLEPDTTFLKRPTNHIVAKQSTHRSSMLSLSMNDLPRMENDDSQSSKDGPSDSGVDHWLHAGSEESGRVSASEEPESVSRLVPEALCSRYLGYNCSSSSHSTVQAWLESVDSTGSSSLAASLASGSSTSSSALYGILPTLPARFPPAGSEGVAVFAMQPVNRLATVQGSRETNACLLLPDDSVDRSEAASYTSSSSSDAAEMEAPHTGRTRVHRIRNKVSAVVAALKPKPFRSNRIVPV